MPRDPLPTLRRLHRIEFAAARLGLAESLRAEAEAAASLDDIEHGIQAEAAVLRARTADQASVDAHAAWLAAKAAAWREARAATQVALMRVEAARRALAETHADSRLLDAVAERGAEQQRVIDGRREQSEMDTAVAGRRVERVTGIEPA